MKDAARDVPRRRSREDRVASYEADVARVLACSEKVKQTISRDFDVQISELPNMNVLILTCPDSASVSDIRRRIHEACGDVESVTEDSPIFLIK
jgi:hypothetical protein